MTLNRGWSYREQVGPDGAGATVLSYLASTRLHSTEAEWAARIERGEVEVESTRVRGDVTLHAGQTIVWHRPPWDEEPVPAHFDVIYEDDVIVVVNKPSGLPTMPAGGFLDHTLLALVRERYPEANPLHRLGRHTSGLVLFARSRDAASRLGSAWRQHKVRKTYRALGRGSTRAEVFAIDVPIGPVPHPLLGTIEAACEGGKPSHSVAVVLEQRHDRTLFSVDITTGRPHQVRITGLCGPSADGRSGIGSRRRTETSSGPARRRRLPAARRTPAVRASADGPADDGRGDPAARTADTRGTSSQEPVASRQ